MADIIPLSLTLDPSQANQSVGSFKAEVKKATQELINMQKQFGETSDEAVKAAKRVAELKDRIGDAQKLTAAFDPDRKFQAVSSSIQAVTGGFSALTGAMALFGVQSDEVQQTLLKVQAALALSEGVNSILEASKAFGNLGTVIKATTAFKKADTIATGLATNAMKLFGITVETTSTSFKVLKTAIAATGIGLLIVALGAAYEAFENFSGAAQRAADAQKKFNDETLAGAKVEKEANLANLELQYQVHVAKLKAENASNEQLVTAQKNYDKIKLQLLQKYHKDAGELDENAVNDIKKQEAQIQIDAYNAQAAANQKALQQEKDQQQKQKEANDKKVAEAKKLQDELYQIHLQTQILLQDGITTQAQQQADEAEAAKEKQKQEDEADAARYATQQENLNKIGKSGLIQQIENERAASDAKIRIAEAEKQAKLENLQAIGNGLNALADLVGQQTVAGKILSIASATINTYVGATKALAQGGFLGIAGATAVIVSGLASVKKIIQTKIPGGKDAGGGTPTSSIPTQAALPIQNPVVRTNTTLDASSINAVGNAAAPVRAYVIDADVQNNRERDTRLSRAARLSG